MIVLGLNKLVQAVEREKLFGFYLVKMEERNMDLLGWLFCYGFDTII